MSLLVLNALAAALLALAGPAHGATGSASARALPEPHLAVAPKTGHVADLLRCLAGRGVVAISAHRGGTEPGYPENAIETFARTLAQAPMLLETDVRRTADGILVLLHDETLDRTTTGTGLVTATRLRDLRTLSLRDAGGTITEFRVPTLDEALGWSKDRAVLLLDIKPGVPLAEVVRAVNRHQAFERTVLIVYSFADAAMVHRLDPRAVLSVAVAQAEELDAIETHGLDRRRIILWTDVGQTLEHPAWKVRWPPDIPWSGGTFWFVDRAVSVTGETRLFRELAERGIALLATGLHQLAWHALDQRQQTMRAFRTCLSADE
jgi:glycerophosphoryl diester phosphodiesterase